MILHGRGGAVGAQQDMALPLSQTQARNCPAPVLLSPPPLRAHPHPSLRALTEGVRDCQGWKSAPSLPLFSSSFQQDSVGHCLRIPSIFPSAFPAGIQPGAGGAMMRQLLHQKQQPRLIFPFP